MKIRTEVWLNIFPNIVFIYHVSHVTMSMRLVDNTVEISRWQSYMSFLLPNHLIHDLFGDFEVIIIFKIQPYLIFL